MKIYVSHSTSFDFKKELYEPLRNLETDEIKFTFPHEASSDQFPTKQMLQDNKFELIIAECSFSSTGQGIELGWADSFGTPIVCILKTGSKYSGSLHTVSNHILEYDELDANLISKILNAYGESR